MKNKLYLFVILALSLSINSCELEPLHSALGVNFEATVNCYTATFTSTAQGEHEWDFGDGTTSKEQNPVHQYGDVGQYNVSLTITSANGAGKMSKTLTIETQGTTFQQEDNMRFGLSLRKKGVGENYLIVGLEQGNIGNSVFEYSKMGEFERNERTSYGDVSYVAAFAPLGTRSISVSNSPDGIQWDFSDATQGAAFDILSSPDTSYHGIDALVPDVLETFVVGTYRTFDTDKSGVFIWNVLSFPIKNITLEFPGTTIVSAATTPDNGIVVAVYDVTQGVFLTKISSEGIQEWGGYIPNTNFEIYGFSLGITALSNDEFVISTANYLNFSGAPREDANAKGYVIKTNKTNEIWRTTIDDVTHLSDIIQTSDGDLFACGGFNNNSLITPYIARLNAEGELLFGKELSSSTMILHDVLETETGEFLLLGDGNSLNLFQVDCGGNL